jgi:hypothetical protein
MARVIAEGAAGSASRSASQLVKRRSELVETATDAGDLVVVVIRQRAQRLASSRSQLGWNVGEVDPPDGLVGVAAAGVDATGRPGVPLPHLAAVALVAQPTKNAAAEPQPAQRVAAARHGEALLGGRRPRRVAADQHRVDRPLLQPAQHLPVDLRGDRRAALVMTALQRVAELQRDDRSDAAQIKPGRRPLAADIDVLEELLDVQLAAAPAQPGVASAVRVAELAAAHPRERAPRHAARANPGAGRAGLADELLDRRLGRVPPAAVLGATQHAVKGRARAAADRAGRHRPAVTQLAGAVRQPIGLVWLPVAVPHSRVPVAQVAAQPLGAPQPARIAARDHAARAEQHQVSRLGHVDVDPKLRPHAGPQHRLPAARLLAGPVTRQDRQTASAHVSAPSRSRTPARSSSARRSSGEACR